MRPFLTKASGVLGLVILAGLWGGSVSAADPSSLRKWISLRFPGLSWVTPEELAGWLVGSQSDGLILLDARSPAEYDVSHLAGARRVDPDASPDDLPSLPQDARVVVYCAVGYRSAAIAKRLEAQGAKQVYNLEGGIFLWANEGRPVVRDGQPVRSVHPYDGIWARYLDESLRAEAQ